MGLRGTQTRGFERWARAAGGTPSRWPRAGEAGAETGLESRKPAPDSDTCTAPGGHRARPAPSRRARTRPAARPPGQLARPSSPARRLPLAPAPAGGRSPPTPRAHTRAPHAPLILFPTLGARAASYLQAGDWRRAEGLRGLNKTLA